MKFTCTNPLAVYEPSYVTSEMFVELNVATWPNIVF